MKKLFIGPGVEFDGATEGDVIVNSDGIEELVTFNVGDSIFTARRGDEEVLCTKRSVKEYDSSIGIFNDGALPVHHKVGSIIYTEMNERLAEVGL